MTLYLATDLIEGQATPMDDERIESRWFTVGELQEAIFKGRIVDGKTITGFLMWKFTESGKRTGNKKTKR